MAYVGEEIVVAGARQLLALRNEFYVATSVDTEPNYLSTVRGIGICVEVAQVSWLGLKTALSHFEFRRDYNLANPHMRISFADAPFVASLIAGDDTLQTP